LDRGRDWVDEAQIQDCLEPPEAEEAGEDPPLEPSSPTNTMGSDPEPPGLQGERAFCCFKLPSLWLFVTATLRESTK
jgi:hypothetical protein